MTDARLPERYLSDRRILRLSASEFRSYTMALLWTVANRTDGFVEPDDLPLIAGFEPQDASALQLAGLWLTEGTGWRLADFAATQTSAHELELLENSRRREREKKGRQRARGQADKNDEETAAAVPRDSPGGGIPRAVPGDTSPGTAQAGRQEGRKDVCEGEQGSERAHVPTCEPQLSAGSELPAAPDHPSWPTPVGPSGSLSRQPAEQCCSSCNRPLDRRLVLVGEVTHPTCDEPVANGGGDCGAAVVS